MELVSTRRRSATVGPAGTSTTTAGAALDVGPKITPRPIVIHTLKYMLDYMIAPTRSVLTERRRVRFEWNNR